MEFAVENKTEIGLGNLAKERAWSFRSQEGWGHGPEEETVDDCEKHWHLRNTIELLLGKC